MGLKIRQDKSDYIEVSSKDFKPGVTLPSLARSIAPDARSQFIQEFMSVNFVGQESAYGSKDMSDFIVPTITVIGEQGFDALSEEMTFRIPKTAKGIHFNLTAMNDKLITPETQLAQTESTPAVKDDNDVIRTLAATGGVLASAIVGRSAQAALPETIVQAVPAVLPKLDTTPFRLASQDFGASNLDRARKLAAEYAKPPQVAAAPEPAPETAEPTELDLLIEKLEKPQPMLARSKHPKEENKPLQQALAMLGELKVGKDGKPDDGYFGKGTEAAVRRIQTEAQKDDPSIAVDGIVGKDTWRIILEKLKEKQAEQQPAVAGLGHFDSPSIPPMAQNEKAASRQA